MIQKQSQLNVADTCTVWTVNTFQVYRGFQHKTASFGDFIKISTRRVKPDSLIKKGKKSKAIFIRSCYKKKKVEGSYIVLKFNDCVLLKKRLTPRGKEIEGPIHYGLKRKKFVASFSDRF